MTLIAGNGNSVATELVDNGGDHGNADVREEEEQKNWKFHSSFLYDYLNVEELEWASLTVQWLPNVEHDAENRCDAYTLLIGTQADGQGADNDNHLLLAKVFIPSQENFVPVHLFNRDEIEIVKRIKHNGHVNRARYMPQGSNIVATRSPNPQIYIFDTDKTGHEPDGDGDGGDAANNAIDTEFSPELVLDGHEAEGYGLNWDPHAANRLLSCADDHRICLWDLNKGPLSSAAKNVIYPETVFTGHSAVVEDVAFNPLQSGLFASVADDCQLMLWDTRTGKTPVKTVKAHSDFVNCLAFHPVLTNFMITGSSDKTVALWDMRYMSERRHFFKQSSAVYSVSFSPHNETVFASAGDENQMYIWDLSKIGEEQSGEDAADGPPELLFVHSGHTNRISDFSWNPKKPWTIASVASDNSMHVWKLAEDIYQEEEPNAPNEELEM